MHIVVTGASGAIGRASLTALIERGHTVVGLHHRPDRAGLIAALGATPAAVDLFDLAAVRDAVDGADAVVHLATSIPPLEKMAKRRSWEVNDRLRIAATATLVDAAIAVGVQRLVLESITFNYADAGDRWIAEDAPVHPVFGATASALVAEQEVARFGAAGRAGVSLRFAQLYGPGASDELVTALRQRKVPLVGSGRNYVSSIHVDDAGRAVAAALDVPGGAYNVCDDTPMRAAERLGVQARSVGARPPRKVPGPVARLMIGAAARQLTQSQRVLNRRFRDHSGWSPIYPSLAEGWPTVTTGAMGVLR